MLEVALISFVLACALLGFGLYRTSTKYTISQRLDKMRQPDVPTTEEELNQPFMQHIILPMGEAMARLVRRYTPTKTRERTEARLHMAGLAPRVTAPQVIGLCWITAGICGLSMVVLAARTDLSLPWRAVIVVLGVVGGHAVPQFILSRRVRERQEAILMTLPYAIDILSISVEAGMGFDAAVAYTARKVKGALADEFSKTLNEARLGKPRLDALDELGKRTGVEELRIFTTAVVHASRLGSSLANTLRIQADSIRVRRRQRVQEKAMKAPVKLVIPLVAFIFPALLIVIVGPAMINIYNKILH